MKRGSGGNASTRVLSTIPGLKKSLGGGGLWVLRMLGKSAFVAAVFFAAALGVRARDVSEARKAADAGMFGEAAHRLRPWFQVGFLDAPSTQLLMQALLESHGDPALSLEAAESCIRRLGANLECVMGVGISLGRQGRYPEAERTLLSIIAQAAELSAPHFHLAEIAEKQGKVLMAFTELQSVVNQTKGDDKLFPLTHLVQYLNKNGKSADATVFLRDLRSMSEGKSLDGLLAVAEAEYQLKDDVGFMSTMRLVDQMVKKSHTPSFYAMDHPHLFRHFDEVVQKEEARQKEFVNKTLSTGK